jgi:hypothetical protein
MSIEIEVPLDKTFNLQEGCYRGRLDSITRKPKTTGKGSGDQVRLLFEMDIGSILKTNKLPFAGRTFDPSLRAGSELREFLENWLGRSYFEAHAGKRINLESLVATRGDLILKHYTNARYENPLVFIQAVLPAGSLPLTEQPQEKEAQN